MTLDIFLIDFENVQPSGLGRLRPGECQIKLFLGDQGGGSKRGRSV